MSTYRPEDFTMAEMKNALRARGLSTNRSKAELIQRLTKADPSAWASMGRQMASSVALATTSEKTGESNEESEAISLTNIMGTLQTAEASVREATTLPTRSLSTEEDMTRELMLLRKEKDLWERERRLFQRELEIVRAESTTSTATANSILAMAGGIGNVKDLLPQFDAVDGTFWRWKRQFILVRDTYQLDDNAARMLISAKLKGKALSWFHSKPEYLTLDIETLLHEMEQMFDLRPSRLSLRKEFEARMWKRDEPFSNYYHGKLILANRVPIAEDELLDYIIEGITDSQLQQQARLMNFQTRTDLLKAFEKITIEQRRYDRGRARDRARPVAAEEAGREALPRKVGQPEDQNRERVESQRKQPVLRRSCFSCNSTEHFIKDCPVRRTSMTAGSPKRSTEVALAEVEQRFPALPDPYTVTMKIASDKNDGSMQNCISNVIIDSGSPISIMRDKVVPRKLRSSAEDVEQFRGINGSPLRVIGIFDGDVEIQSVRVNLKFHIVPDDTMVYDALLGRDFLTYPLLRVTLGKTVEVAKVRETCEENEIMHIECVEEPYNVRDNLQINPGVSQQDDEKIREAYRTRYIGERETESCMPDYEMKIALKHEQPVSARPRRISFADRQALQKVLDDLLEKGIIRPSDSPYASPIVLVRKKDRNIRLCVDYRELNKITVRDNFPTELIEDNIDRLKNKRYFTVLDLKDGFYHVKMHESSIKFTSFVTPIGQFEFLRMPFGLMNAPRVFQRYIHVVFAPLIRESKILLYLDDILVATGDMEEHIEILSDVFELAGKHRLQFRLDKCYFARTEIRYLGYCIDQHGVRPSDENIEAVLRYPVPRNAKELHRFVGLASYFRRFIPSFSILAKPLYNLLKKDSVYKFGEEENGAFEKLKYHLSHKPVLEIYSPQLETELHCDASASGYGAILMQRQADKMWRPVSFWSLRTTPTESKYHSYELECLACVYAIKRFHVYLAGLKFKLITDCDSFRMTLNKRDVNPRISRWALFLQNYNFDIVHRPGKQMGHVDALSRCCGVLVLEGSTLERTLSIQQDRDENIVKIRSELEKRNIKDYELRDGLVYRKNRNKKLLFYVPRSMEPNVIRTCHDDLGHVGADKVVDSITKVYWFPRMRDKVKEYIMNCLRCIEFSPSSGKAEGYLHSVPKSNLPFVTIHIDHLGPLEKTGKGYKYLFVVVDAFTKFIRIYSCKSTKTEESIRHLVDYFRAYSKPKCLISDRGTCFTSDAFREFLENRMINHVLIAVGTPRANGQVERYNRVIIPMLAKLSDASSKWDRVLKQVEYALNNTFSRVTNETPSRLLFGVEQRGETDDILRELITENEDSERDLVTLRNKAKTNIEDSQRKNATRYNLRRKPAREYRVGDYVEIRNVEATAGVNKKLIPLFKGPYRIEKVLDHDRYVITDVDGFQITQRPYTGVVAPDMMRPYISS